MYRKRASCVFRAIYSRLFSRYRAKIVIIAFIPIVLAASQNLSVFAKLDRDYRRDFPFFYHNHWGETWRGSNKETSETGLTLLGGSGGLYGSGSRYGIRGHSQNGYGIYSDGDMYAAGDFSATGSIRFSELTTDGIVTINGGVLGSKAEGAGRGLNADLLDGHHASDFMLAADDHWGESWSGTGTGLTLSGGSTGLRSSGSEVGVYGVGVGIGGVGVYGGGTSGTGVYGSSGSSYGVYGGSTSGVGVYGSSVSGRGVSGSSSSDIGVRGQSEYSYGVYGGSGGSYGVYGNSDTSYGVYGTSSNNIGIYGTSDDRSGVYGRSVHNRGVSGYSDHNVGVFGFSDHNTAIHGHSNSCVGIYGSSESSYSVYAVASTSNHDFYVEGNGHATGSFTEGSDIRWKKNVSNIASGLSSILQLRPVYYDWRVDEFSEQGFDKGRQVGMIAQEVELVAPELVTTDNVGEEGYKGIAYGKLGVLLVAAIQEQQAQIEELRAVVDKQQVQIDELRAIVEELQGE